MPKIGPNQPCPCVSQRKYKKCCRPLHTGGHSPTAVALMRSRFSAYALGLTDYIIETTDPNGPQWQADRLRWQSDVSRFSKAYDFVHLAILSHETVEETGTVSFRATLNKGSTAEFLVEKSRFSWVSDRWLYHSGIPLEHP